MARPGVASGQRTILLNPAGHIVVGACTLFDSYEVELSSHFTLRRIHRGIEKGGVVVKLRVRESESIQEAVRRFRKLVERSGIKKEMRRREYYEKPSDSRRRARLRAERRARRTRLLGR